MKIDKVKEVVRVASRLLAIPSPTVRTVTKKEQTELFTTPTQRAVADCNRNTVILRNGIGDTANDLLQAIFAALHELRHLWQFKRIFSEEQFAEKELWLAEFNQDSLPNGDKEAYNKRSVEVDAHAFAVFAMEAICGIKMRVTDLPNSEAIQQRYEQIKKEFLED